ncbi:MAG: hypothetical protein JO197_16775 [Acidobacteria bacterium]|nr:hypothetical protein [Acidobacteriota bacterium]MBV9478523.1 hypothetical protein [Acidobacteriota bacterium]
MLALPVAERMALALRLGAEAVADLAAARGITHDEAARVIRRQRRQGRRYSRCIEELDESDAAR